MYQWKSHFQEQDETENENGELYGDDGADEDGSRLPPATDDPDQRGIVCQPADGGRFSRFVLPPPSRGNIAEQ